MIDRELTTVERDVLISLLTNDIWYDGCEWGQDDTTRDTLSALAWDGYVTCNDLGVYFMNEVQQTHALKNYDFVIQNMHWGACGFPMH